jgi:dihydroxy-acid dehydratase
LRLAVEPAELERRRQAILARGAQPYRPAKRERTVSTYLKAYAALATSAATGAVRDLSRLG